MSNHPKYNQWTTLIVNGVEKFQGHFDMCVNNAAGYPGKHIIIKPKPNK